MATEIQHGEPAIAKSNGIELVYDTFGNPTAPPMVLIQGLGQQMISWDDEFCAQLASRGYWVIRFDNRDIGLSTKFEAAGIPDIMGMLGARMAGQAVRSPYSFADMAADTVGLLDALSIRSAHIVGMSMGGMIAQTLALAYPNRVRTLTSMMSTTNDPALPGPKPEVGWVFVTPTPTERDKFIAFNLQLWSCLSGPGYPFDEALTRARAARIFDRGVSVGGTARQLAAILAANSRRAALASLKIPTLVIHGDADPLVPVECGLDTHKSIPGAKLLLIPGMGHGLPPGAWLKMIDAVAAHAG